MSQTTAVLAAAWAQRHDTAITEAARIVQAPALFTMARVEQLRDEVVRARAEVGYWLGVGAA